MKKQAKKLVLAKETVKNLIPDLRLVAGGALTDTWGFGCTGPSNPLKCFAPPSSNC